MAPLTFVFIIDPPDRLDPPTDTSLAIMRESVRRGHPVFFCHIGDLRLVGHHLWARVRPISFRDNQELFTAEKQLELDLEKCDVLFMRKDPPVDAAYLHATYLLDHLPARTLQVNPAAALRNWCEKLIPTGFPDLMPETLVTASIEALASFLHRVRHMVIKPLEDCSGRGIIKIEAGHSGSMDKIREAVDDGRRIVQGQRFLSAIDQGDKRVLLLGGEILGWVKRLPAKGDFRSNVNAGGRCVPCELTEQDHAICKRIGPWLKERGIHLAGVDIVDGKVLEVNITSPSCLREINHLYGKALEVSIVDYVEQNCRRR